MNISLSVAAGAGLSIIFTWLHWQFRQAGHSLHESRDSVAFTLLVHMVVGGLSTYIFLVLFGNTFEYELQQIPQLAFIVGTLFGFYAILSLSFDEGFVQLDRDSLPLFDIGIATSFYVVIVGIAFIAGWQAKYVLLAFVIFRPALSFIVYRILTTPSKKDLLS